VSEKLPARNEISRLIELADAHGLLEGHFAEEERARLRRIAKIVSMPRRKRPLAKLTRREKEEYLLLVSAGLSQAQACQLLGIWQQAVEQATRDDPSFRAALEGALEQRLEEVEERLRQIALYGDTRAMTTVRAAETLLRARYRSLRPPAYGATATVDGSAGVISVKVGTPIPD
jgi:hypothetical protein